MRAEQGKSYLAVINGGEVVCEQSEDEVLRFNEKADGVKISATSAGETAGSAAGIKMDGVEYAKGAAGLNIVVWDKVLKRVVSSAVLNGETVA